MSPAVKSSVCCSAEEPAPWPTLKVVHAKNAYMTALAADFARSPASPWLTTASSACHTVRRRKPTTQIHSRTAPVPDPDRVWSAPEVSACCEPPPMPHATLRAIHAMRRWIRPSTA